MVGGGWGRWFIGRNRGRRVVGWAGGFVCRGRGVVGGRTGGCFVGWGRAVVGRGRCWGGIFGGRGMIGGLLFRINSLPFVGYLEKITIKFYSKIDDIQTFSIKIQNAN